MSVVTRMLRSTAAADCVSAPTEMIVHPGQRVLADIFERDAARGLERNLKAAAAHDAHRLLHLRRAHVVQQQRLRAAVRACSSSSKLRTSHVTVCPGVRAARARATTFAMPPPSADVIALDQNAVGKIEPMALAAAATHRVLVQHAQPGNGLARVQHLGLRARDRIHVLPGQVAMPLIRCIRFRITRSQARMARALLRITATA